MSKKQTYLVEPKIYCYSEDGTIYSFSILQRTNNRFEGAITIYSKRISVAELMFSVRKKHVYRVKDALDSINNVKNFSLTSARYGVRAAIEELKTTIKQAATDDKGNSAIKQILSFYVYAD